MTLQELEDEFREFRMEYNTNTMEILQGYFVGYKGDWIRDYELIDALNKYARSDEVVKSVAERGVFLGKIVPRAFENYRQPLNRCKKVSNSYDYLVVGSHNLDQAMEMMRGKFGYIWSLQSLLCNQYAWCKSEIFESLRDKLDFSAVIYDKKEQSLIAGNTTQHSAYSTLYYGYHEDKKYGLMFSNNAEIVDAFCSEVFVMPPNAYVQDGKLYWSNGRRVLQEPKRVKTTKKTIEELEHKVADLEEKYNTLLSYFLSEQEQKEHDSLGTLVKK